MRRDIDDALSDWPYDPEPGEFKAREIRARDGRIVIQVRVELGIMQMETDGRPDGVRPNGFATYLDYLAHKAANAARGSDVIWLLSPEHCLEADREIVQFYHRRMAWLSLQRYEKALDDANHSLAMMNFVEQHSVNESYKISHERYRGLVLFHQTQANVAILLSQQKPEEAIDAVREGRDKLTLHQRTWETRVEHDDTPNEQLIEQLTDLENEIRKNYEVEKTLREQLDEAVAQEEYEKAARLRDQIRAKGGKV